MDDHGSNRPPAGPARIPLGAAASARASRHWWDADAAAYAAEHGAFLGDADLVWGPEGLREADAGLLGPVAGLDVLEVGCGSGSGARWLTAVGARAVGLDVSGGMLAQARPAEARCGLSAALVQADAGALPFATGSFDLACSAYGALPFVADLVAVHREVGRVLRPGGRWVFSVTHPVRWAFPDDPGESGLTARTSYFDRRPYVEIDDDGQATYVEHHRTLGDHVRALRAAGLRLHDLVEPEWPEDHDQVWGGWSPLRGRLLPGTAIFIAERP